MAEYITHSRAETVALGKRMAAVLQPGALIAFTGGLGAGKTAFTEGLAEGLAEGRASGLAEGRRVAMEEAVRSLMASTGWDERKAMEALGMVAGQEL